ncbi:MAG: MopE-related protein [Candidatus Anstonellaceae archaeon]
MRFVIILALVSALLLFGCASPPTTGAAYFEPPEGKGGGNSGGASGAVGAGSAPSSGGAASAGASNANSAASSKGGNSDKTKDTGAAGTSKSTAATGQGTAKAPGTPGQGPTDSAGQGAASSAGQGNSANTPAAGGAGLGASASAQGQAFDKDHQINRIFGITGAGGATGAILPLQTEELELFQAPRTTGGKQKPACSDGRDNDGDGLCDYNGVYNRKGALTCAPDPGCNSTTDIDEYNCIPTNETCDGIDNDCDLSIDEGGVCQLQAYYCDKDADTYKAMNASGSCSAFNCVPTGCQLPVGNDCNDNNSLVNPGRVEQCDSDRIDNDCDGLVDECTCTNGLFDPGQESDVDCGLSCGGCAIGQNCLNNSDCAVGTCSGGKCTQQAGCMELFPGTNDQSADRVNMVFVPINFTDMNRFLSATKQALDYYGNINGTGLFELSVYKDSKNKFNFWYIDRSFAAQGDPTVSCTYASNPESANYCTGLPNKFELNIANLSFRSCAYYWGPSFNSLPNMPYVLEHEFQHQVPHLCDEYIEGTRDSPCSPNCAPDLATAQQWWGDLYGTVADGYTTGYFDGCSYVLGNYRPTSNSIMRANYYALGAVNQRQVASVLSTFSGTVAAPSSSLEVTLSGSPGDINTFQVTGMEQVSTSENPFAQTGPHKLKIKAGGKTFAQAFSINDYLYEDELSGGQVRGGVKVTPKSSVKVRVRLPPGAAYDKAQNKLLVDGKMELPEVAIEKGVG